MKPGHSVAGSATFLLAIVPYSIHETSMTNLTLKQLRSFVAIAERGSFTEAGKRLCLTQTALSVQVRELESELDAKVFDRKTRTVQLTEIGQALYPHAKRVLSELEAGYKNVVGLRDKERGLLRLGATQLVACTILPDLISQFRARYPQVDIRFQDVLPETMLNSLLVGEVELVLGPQVKVNTEVNCNSLLSVRNMLVCPPEHPLARFERVTWSQVAEWPFISPTKDFIAQLRECFRVTGVDQPPIEATYEASYATTVLGMVSAGLGVTTVPVIASDLVRLWKLEMRELVDPQFHRDLCIYISAAQSLSPAAESFVELSREARSASEIHQPIKNIRLTARRA